MKPVIEYNTIYIGAGPATIFSVLEHPTPNSLIIEKGKSIKDRTRKDVIFGFAGAGCFSDSKLIGSNGRITQLKPNIDYKEYANKILYWYNKFSDEKVVWKEPDPYEIPSDKLYLIKSRVCHYGTDRSKIVFTRMEEHIQKNICTINFEEEVVGVRKCKSGFYLITTKASYRAKRVVIATGTRDELLENFAHFHNCKKKNNAIQIGVRVECPNHFLKELVDKFYDFKIAMKTKSGYWRSFCVNSGSAYVTVERDGNYVSANGHSYANKPGTGLTNFGILGALNLSYNKMQQIQLAKDVAANTNRLLAQNIKDFLAEKPTHQLNYTTTVNEKDYRLGDLTKVLPREIYQELKEYIIELKKYYKLKGHFFAPEINLVNPLIDTNNKLEIYPNVFIAGDVMITRSIVDAGISGILVGESLCE